MEILNPAPLDEVSLRAFIEKPESDDLEFKATILSNSEIADYVVGIGNAGGGFLIMGVTDKRPRRIAGLGELSADALQKVRRSLYDSTSVRVELEPVSTAEGFVLCVRIPPRPPGTVLNTREGKYLIRVGEALVGLTATQVHTMLSESRHPSDTADELPISVRFTMLQHSQNYSVLVRNDSDLEIQTKEVWLEKDCLKLADPAKKQWPAIAPRSAGTLFWQPNRNPEEFLTIKWRERMAGKGPLPAQSFMDEIDVTIVFTLPGGRRGQHRERIMVLVDYLNHTMQQWS